MDFEFCRYDKVGHVARITITRPEVYNALHARASHDLARAWDDFAADDDLWVAVVTGEGEKAFCAGFDLKSAGTASANDPWPETGFGGLTGRFDLFKPVIARVNGFALGGGLEIALACDIIIATDDTEIGLPEVKRGLFANALGVHRLPRQIPQKVAMLHLLTGRHIPTPRAYEIGLVSELVPRADLDAAVDRCVEDILACAPLAVRLTKETAVRGREMPLEEAASARYSGYEAWRNSADRHEGPRAFAEKRRPTWTGR